MMLAWEATVPASAAPQDVTEGFSRAYQACITYGETHNTTAIPAAECNAREWRTQDARLNASYKTAMTRLSPTRRTALRAEERAWIASRDRRCGRMGDVEMTVECKIDETIKRTRYLGRYR